MLNNLCFFISVFIDKNMYDRYVFNNKFITNKTNIRFVSFDNKENNIFISKRYNDFLNNYDYSTDAWFIFCHSDWEVAEDISEILSKLNKSKIYGPIGCYFTQDNERAFKGCCFDVKRDGSSIRFLGNKNFQNPIVDTLDCQAVFVHSSLINKHNLRFDENLEWDLYVEDFCINAKRNHNIDTNVINIQCYHHSDSGSSLLPKTYYKMLTYLNNKYSDKEYAGVCSAIGGKKSEIFERLRKQLKSNL